VSIHNPVTAESVLRSTPGATSGPLHFQLAKTGNLAVAHAEKKVAQSSCKALIRMSTRYNSRYNGKLNTWVSERLMSVN